MNIQRRARVAVLSAVLLAAFMVPGAAFAQEGGLVDQVSNAEQIVFGHARPGANLGNRVDSLEMSVFGKTNQGSLIERLKGIHKMIVVEPSKQAEAAKPAQPAPAVSKKESQPSKAALPTGPTTKVTAASGTKTALKPLKAKAAGPQLAALTPTAGMPPKAPDRKLSSAKDLVKTGTERFSLGRFDEAENIFHEALVRDPHNTDALYNLGALAERRGDLLSALSSYKMGLSLKEDDADLKGAVASVEHQLAQQGSSAGSHMLFGGAMLNQAVAQAPQRQFVGQAQPARMAVPQVGQVGQAPLVGQATVAGGYYGMAQVTQPNPAQLKAEQPQPAQQKNRPAQQAWVQSVKLFHAMPINMPFKCPICAALEKL